MYKNLTPDEQKKARELGYTGLFSERETTKEAYDYMMALIETLPSMDKAAMITGLHVFTNTLAVTLATEGGPAK